jgi:hypothetical protein
MKLIIVTNQLTRPLNSPPTVTGRSQAHAVYGGVMCNMGKELT